MCCEEACQTCRIGGGEKLGQHLPGLQEFGQPRSRLSELSKGCGSLLRHPAIQRTQDLPKHQPQQPQASCFMSFARPQAWDEPDSGKDLVIGKRQRLMQHGPELLDFANAVCILTAPTRVDHMPVHSRLWLLRLAQVT